MYLIQTSGSLVCRHIPSFMYHLPEKYPELTKVQRDEIDAIRKKPSWESSIFSQYTGNLPFELTYKRMDESWLSLKKKTLEQKIEFENEKKAEILHLRCKGMRDELSRLYQQSLQVNGLQRVSDDYFEILDLNWIKLRKMKEKEIADVKIEAQLELIGQELYKKKLLAKYWDPLSTRLQSLFAFRSDTKVTNFSVPKKSPALTLLLQRTRLQRNVDAEVISRQRQKEAVEKVHTSDEPKDYVRKTMLDLCGGET